MPRMTDSAANPVPREIATVYRTQREPLTLERIRTKQIQVGVIGLGYVGLPLSLVFAEADVPVLGFDVDRSKIESLAAGKSYFRHLSDERLSRVSKNQKFAATDDMSRIAECDVVIICVPTPLTPHLEPDLQYIEKTCASIAQYIRPYTLVSLESTTWPGTTAEVVKPLLESTQRVKAGETLYLSFSPEREDPGNPQFGTKSIPKLVGGYDATSLELATAVYALGIDKVVAVSSTQVAEAAKLFENIFRCVNIALVNELKQIFTNLQIDVWEVIQAASSKPFGFMPFWPGPGLGGHCIPIDPFYLTWKAREVGFNTRFIELAGEINRGMPRWVVSKVQDCLNQYQKPLKGSRILVLGLAYKPNVSDIRESPSLELIELLEHKGADVAFYDPLVPVIPKTREYGALAGRQSCEPSAEYDCFLMSTHHNCFSVDALLFHQVPIVDTRNVFPKSHPLVYQA